MTNACGDCSLCCTLLPVRAIEKPGAQRCQHQCATGCAVYPKLMSIAPECRLWSCLWLSRDQDDATELLRPDQCGYVVDPMPDFVTAQDNETRQETQVPAIQVWIDPTVPGADEAPTLRAYLERKGAQGWCAIIRKSPKTGYVLFPPSMTGGQWFKHDGSPTERTHTVEEVLDAIGRP